VSRLVALDRPVGVQEEHRDRARAGELGSHGEIRPAVGVQVAEGRHGAAEGGVRGRESGLRDQLLGTHRAEGIEEQDPDRPREVGVARLSERQVEHAIGVQVPEGSDRRPEAREQAAAETARGAADLELGSDRSVAVQEEQPQGAARGLSVVVARGADGEIRHPVPVEVAQGTGRGAEGVARIEIAAETARRVADATLGGNAAVRFKGEEPQLSRSDLRGGEG
jgi:hypothetical protein